MTDASSELPNLTAKSSTASGLVGQPFVRHASRAAALHRLEAEGGRRQLWITHSEMVLFGNDSGSRSMIYSSTMNLVAADHYTRRLRCSFPPATEHDGISNETRKIDSSPRRGSTR